MIKIQLKIPINQFSDENQAQNTSLDSATAYKSKQQQKSSLKIEIRVQNQSQSHEFDQKELKNLTKLTKIESKSIAESQLGFGPGYRSKQS